MNDSESPSNANATPPGQAEPVLSASPSHFVKGRSELGRHALDQIFFVLGLLFHVVVDSAFLIGFYFWKVFVDYILGDFEGMTGWEHVLFIYVKAALILTPIIGLSWYVFVNLLGIFKRVWETRW